MATVFGALAQLVERLLCKQDVVGSTPSGSTITHPTRSESRSCFPVQSDAGSGKAAAFTSFREIISVVGRTRVGVRWFCKEPTAALSKSSTLTKSFPSGKGGNSCMLIWKEACGPVEGPEDAAAMRVFLLPGQIKRDKGVWWMPWQQEAMKDAIPCDKLWGAGNRL